MGRELAFPSPETRQFGFMEQAKLEGEDSSLNKEEDAYESLHLDTGYPFPRKRVSKCRTVQPVVLIQDTWAGRRGRGFNHAYQPRSATCHPPSQYCHLCSPCPPAAAVGLTSQAKLGNVLAAGLPPYSQMMLARACFACACSWLRRGCCVEIQPRGEGLRGSAPPERRGKPVTRGLRCCTARPLQLSVPRDQDTVSKLSESLSRLCQAILL